jgi:hypothetical protein
VSRFHAIRIDMSNIDLCTSKSPFNLYDSLDILKILSRNSEIINVVLFIAYFSTSKRDVVENDVLLNEQNQIQFSSY